MRRRADICKLVVKELLSLNVYFRYYRKPIALGLFFVLLSNIAGVYIPVLVRQGLDEAVFASKLSALLEGAGNAGTIAMVFGLLIIMASLIKGLFMYLMRQKIVVVSRHIEYDLKNDLYQHYQQLDVAFYRRNFTGDMMARIGEDVSNVRMYTGDDFNYAELIAGDGQGAHLVHQQSDALLGIFDAIAPAASAALGELAQGNAEKFHAILGPTVPLSRHIFKAPTRFYKTGVVFMAWLNGHQSHFTMVGGQQSTRSVLHLAELFKLADTANLLEQPDLALHRMKAMLALHGVE